MNGMRQPETAAFFPSPYRARQEESQLEKLLRKQLTFIYNNVIMSMLMKGE